jgi:hypothetical protein
MNILFIHQNFPGQFKLLSRMLAALSNVRVVGLGDIKNLKELKNSFAFPVLGYNGRNTENPNTHHYLRGLEGATRRGQDVVRACQDLKKRGFTPDLVVGHPGWGELLFIKDVFPNAALIGYFEFFYQSSGADFGFDPEFPSSEDAMYRLRLRNTVQLQALAACDAGLSPTAWQRSMYPKRDQSFIEVIHEGIDSDHCKPNADASAQSEPGRSGNET